MSTSDPLNHYGSIWYHSRPSYVPYSPNQFLGLDFFVRFLQQDGSKIVEPTNNSPNKNNRQGHFSPISDSNNLKCTTTLDVAKNFILIT